MSKYIDVEKLQAEIERSNLKYWLEYFGMPKKNIELCATQIAQGYGFCRYLVEDIRHRAEAVSELAEQKLDTWKPSKEQMEGLRNAINWFSLNKPDAIKKGGLLLDLYKELQNLM